MPSHFYTVLPHRPFCVTMMKVLAVFFSVVGPSLVSIMMVATATADLSVGKFWHVTDFHYDHTYWGEQLSCNKAELQGQGRQPQLGTYWCDSPWALVTASIQAMVHLEKDVDFLIWTGDTVAHIEDKDLSVDINMDILRNLTDSLRHAFPGKTVYASYGNHDYYPSDQFPHLNNLMYNLTADIWSGWIQEPAQLDNFKKGGYYSRLVSQGLRVVALNTNLYYTSNHQTPGTEDPSDQIQWLRGLLQSAREAGEKVILTAHIPPGVHTPSRVVWYHEEFQEPFQSALQEFGDVLVAMHFGHDHADGFKVLYDKQGKAAVPLFMAPSVTPWRYSSAGPAHNPSVRLVTYDRASGQHLDIRQFRLDLPAAANQQDSPANFTLLYSFAEHYNVSDLSAQSLDALVTRMESGRDRDQLLDDYFWFATAGADQGQRECDTTCKARILCGFKHYDYHTFDACVTDYVSSASGLIPITTVVVFMLVTVFNLAI